MARKYRRDARGRFAGGGYQGQTGGRGARLKSGGNVRKGGGAKVRAAAAPMRAGTIAKGGNGVRGSVARSLAAVKRKPATATATPAMATTGRTRAQAAAAQRDRNRRLKRPNTGQNAQPAAKSTGASSEPKIFGYSWGQIQAAQNGLGSRALSGGRITGKAQRPKATKDDVAMQRKIGLKGIRKQGLFGVLDRLTTSRTVISRRR